MSHTLENPSAVLRIQFDDDGNWSALPSWGNFFIDIGYQLGLAPSAEHQLMAACVVPTRAYCAAFVALGVVLAAMVASAPRSRAEHFARITQLERRTPVLYRRQGRILKAVTDGIEVRDGQPHVRLRVGNLQSFLVPEKLAENVQPMEGRPWPLSDYQRGRKVSTGVQFAEELLGRVHATAALHESNLDVVLIGRRNTLEHEIRHASLAVAVDTRQHVDGTLQDALRVRRFTQGAPYRSDILSTDSRRPPASDQDSTPLVSVFDGASPFLRWRHLWLHTHQVAVLDRTDSRLDEAVSTLNQDYLQRRTDDGGIPIPHALPPGSELFIYSRTRPS